jgi:5-methylcytosine-specific restriction endonuclease McrA
VGRLTNLSPTILGLPARLGRQTDAEGHSKAAEPWRRWYSTAEWAQIRKDVFVRDGFTCQCGCATFIGNPRERIADHKRPHRGDRGLFFDPDNVQTLWKPHHDGWKQRLERRDRG